MLYKIFFISFSAGGVGPRCQVASINPVQISSPTACIRINQEAPLLGEKVGLFPIRNISVGLRKEGFELMKGWICLVRK